MKAKGLPKKLKIHRELEAQILAALATKKEFDSLKMFYQALDSATPATLTSAEFNAENTASQFQPVSWQLFPSESVNVAFYPQENSQNRRLIVKIGTGTRATVAHKLLYLEAGRYRFTSKLSVVREGVIADTTWQLRCAITGVEFVVSGDEFIVPSGCPVTALDFLISGGDSSDGVEFAVEDVLLKKMQ